MDVTVDGTSVRGRVTGTLPGLVEDRPKAWGYSVGLAGEGTYVEDRTYKDQSSRRTDHHATKFAFQAAWPRIVIPADGSAPLVDGRVSRQRRARAARSRARGPSTSTSRRATPATAAPRR